jgi:hypothetical protein
MQPIEELLSENGLQLVRDIQFNMSSAGQNATGETAQSLTIEIQKEGTKLKMTLTGRPFFMTVQTGRRPTPGKKPSREMINNITKWVNARGMDESAAWAIATNIQKQGTKLWQSGGRTDIVDPAVEDFINNTSEAMLENEAERFKIKIQEFQPEKVSIKI